MTNIPSQQRSIPRKSPRQSRSLETVKAIVEATARILEEKGLGGLTTNAVAERAGVSIGSLYQYFQGKDALIGALILRETALLIADWEAATTAETGEAALALLIAAAVAHQLRRPVLARLLDIEEARLPLDPAVHAVSVRLREIVTGVLQRSDLPPQADPALAAQDMLAIIKGMVDAAGAHGERDRPGLEERVGRAVRGYLGYR
ncbi:TetR/AcrR family transcriptional regulator [Sphingobium sp. B7D2B]|uniref:TetR/AcrR family transcriptional regulator n=1 Tax=Sphingobium sp. B7D2B TaxID=2940583 RepID=UPI00222402CC|nr:TetR/AcrR family transcriptional regulator [Sphingobium sp. B7D2B]